MKKLLKAYQLESVEDYRLMVLTSLENGQRKQAKEQFMAMPKAERIEFLKDMIYNYHTPPQHIFFFNAIFGL